MHSRETVAAALEMSRSGASSVAIGSALGIPARTVRDWVRGSVPRFADAGLCSRCLGRHEFSALTSEYVYVLGLYLGDGCLSQHPRDVYKLRLTLDAAYPKIVASALGAVRAVAGKGGVYRRSDHCVEVFSYWRQWPCHFPQHGPGPKHARPVALTAWQHELTRRWPHHLLRGLIHSDGCRVINTGSGGWSAPRYAFKNHSEDIHRIFQSACGALGLRYSVARHVTYISRKADVTRLDEFVGPKA
ncbi:MAG TPA: hypothetical protein VE127_16980 [Solirubrobacteraceae bacterium]|nr:hypothetical protein [Solirubrobacteraceae bacterium]